MAQTGEQHRRGPEAAAGAAPADACAPEHSQGQPLDDPQPSTSQKALQAQPEGRPQQISQRERASLESLLEGVALPATRGDLIRYVRRARSPEAIQTLKRLPPRRFSSIDEVGEQLAPVQPQWPRTHREPLPESDLPPGGRHYGAMPR